MDPNNTYVQTTEDQKLQGEYKIQMWKDRIFRFFYNIWPAVNRVLAFFFYHTMRVLRGFFRTAFESITNKQ